MAIAIAIGFAITIGLIVFGIFAIDTVCSNQSLIIRNQEKILRQLKATPKKND